MSITIGIITKDRSDKLKSLLASLGKVNSKTKIIIVDNSSNFGAISHNFNLAKRFKATYIQSNEEGYSFSRNAALGEVETEWLLFLDDDCQVTKTLLTTADSLTRTHSQYVAFNGVVKPKSTSNSFEHASIFLNQLWKQKSSLQHGWALDTKCCLINVGFLNKNSILFDVNRVINNYGGEDLDLGISIAKKGGQITLAQDLTVFHHEPKSVGSYFKILLKRTKTNAFVFYKNRNYFKQAAIKTIKKDRELFFLVKIEEYKKTYKLQNWPFFFIICIISVAMYRAMTSLFYIYYYLCGKLTTITNSFLKQYSKV